MLLKVCLPSAVIVFSMIVFFKRAREHIWLRSIRFKNEKEIWDYIAKRINLYRHLWLCSCKLKTFEVYVLK